MKTIASLAIATLTFAAVPAVQAHDLGKKIIVKNHGLHSHSPHYCAPYLVCTKEINRCYHTQWGYDSHGCLISYNVLVITYANYYSNGTSHSYTRSYRV